MMNANSDGEHEEEEYLGYTGHSTELTYIPEAITPHPLEKWIKKHAVCVCCAQ